MPRVSEELALKPAEGVDLSLLQLAKSEFTVLFTYNTLESPGIDPTKNHPELGRRIDASVAGDSVHQSTLSTYRIPEPKNTGNLSYTSAEDDTDKLIKGDLRILVSPGRPPFAATLPKDKLSFMVPITYGHDLARYAFEDTCRLAMQSEKLAKIKNASFVTDADTLSYLYYTLYNLSVNSNNTKKKAKDLGLWLTVHDVNGITFIKALNGHVFDGRDGKAAMKHLQDEALQHYWKMEGDESQDSSKINKMNKMSVYKRVVGFVFGNYSLVVEDTRQVTLTKRDPRHLNVDFDHDRWDQPRHPASNNPVKKSDPEGVPAYAFFRGEADEVSPEGSDGLLLFAKPSTSSKTKASPKPENWPMYELMDCNLWFLEHSHAIIANHTKVKLSERTAVPVSFTKGNFEWHRVGKDDSTTDQVDDDESGEEMGEEMDDWHEAFSNGYALKLLHHFMDSIKEFIEKQNDEQNENENENEKESCRFVLKHLNKSDEMMAIAVLSDEAAPVKLVSDMIAEQL
ncbi:hypothetical protein M434DRAFT_27708 [Hypoxylon sp. CO27-5]|nr:hypothetical protein M434DRAFT_27708 [Hypoxylon sp. CO27-5]